MLFGIDQLDVLMPHWQGKRLAALTHAASVNAKGLRLPALVQAHGSHLKKIFAPEHGFWGVAQDMEVTGNGFYHGVPVVSLYGRSSDSLAPSAEMLCDIDCLVIDLVDIGTRYYTFVASAIGTARAALNQDIKVVVLDRPNPLGGLVREGGPIFPGYESFVGDFSAPVRHALTLGEIVQREMGEMPLLEVVCVKGWEDRSDFRSWGRPWPWPSPNMPTFETAALYPGMCLIEGTELSEGRGTTKPLEMIGAPFIDAPTLVRRLKRLCCPGVDFSEVAFKPMFQKWAGEICHGVRLHVQEFDKLRSLESVALVIKVIHDLYPDDFAWRTRAYEFIADRPAIDLLIGNSEFRERVDQGKPLEPMFAGWREYCAEFK